MTIKNDMNRLQYRKGGLLKLLLKKGDTLFSIARENELSIADLLEANPQIKNPDSIYAGDNLFIPSKNKPEIKKESLLNTLFKKESKRVSNKIKRNEIKSKEFSVFKNLLGYIPLNVKQLIYDVSGGEQPLTELDLRDDEKNALINIVRQNQKAQKNNIEYKDYKTSDVSEYGDVGYNRIKVGTAIEKFKDPYYALKTTLGQASITQDNKGNTIVKDRYNFNDNDGQTTLDELYSDMKAVYKNPLYQIPRKIGKYFGSAEGEGSPIEINLGKII